MPPVARPRSPASAHLSRSYHQACFHIQTAPLCAQVAPTHTPVTSRRALSLFIRRSARRPHVTSCALYHVRSGSRAFLAWMDASLRAGAPFLSAIPRAARPAGVLVPRNPACTIHARNAREPSLLRRVAVSRQMLTALAGAPFLRRFPDIAMLRHAFVAPLAQPPTSYLDRGGLRLRFPVDSARFSSDNPSNMFLILVLISSGLIVCIGLLLRKHHNQCVICGRGISHQAKTCSARCRQTRHRLTVSHPRDGQVTPLKRARDTSPRERGGEKITITDNS